MSALIIVDARDRAILAGSGLHVVAPEDYLAGDRRRWDDARVFLNLTANLSYQSIGYYCSLLAEARHRLLYPALREIADMLHPVQRKSITEQLQYAAARPQVSKSHHRPKRILIFMGRSSDPAYEEFGRNLFEQLSYPLLEAVIDPRRAQPLISVRVPKLRDLTRAQVKAFISSIKGFAPLSKPAASRRRPVSPHLAIFYDPNETDAPADPRTNRHFAKLARQHGVETSTLSHLDLTTLARFDGLWIRSLTSVHSPAYAFARFAERLGIPVIDSSNAILACGNKIFVAERLSCHAVPVPETQFVDSHEAIAAHDLAFPVVLKGPDGSFCRAVHKADDFKEVAALTENLRLRSHLILAQEFVPTAFDWRIGIIDGRPLYACQYRMARGHWQIVKYRGERRPLEGGFAAIPLTSVPPAVMKTALDAASAIGDGLYGIDLKETGRGVVVIEINDNPDIKRGIEDSVEGEQVWLGILAWFKARWSTGGDPSRTWTRHPAALTITAPGSTRLHHGQCAVQRVPAGL